MSNRNRLVDNALQYIEVLENNRMLRLNEFGKSHADILASSYTCDIKTYINTRYSTYSGRNTSKRVILINKYNFPSKLKIYIIVTPVYTIYKTLKESNLLIWSLNYTEER